MSPIFLSYSRSDAQIVDKIADDLQKEGFDIWFDRQNLIAGDNWQVQIEKALIESSFIVVFISQNSLQSTWVQEEYRLAFEYQQRAGGNRLIPILLEKVKLPVFLSGMKYADFTESYHQGMREMIHALKAPAGVRLKDVIPVDDLAKEVAIEVARILGLETKTLPTKLGSYVDSKLVFVIIAFQDDMEPIFEGVKAAGNSVGLEVKRVKDIIGDYRITDQIIKMINSARFIVADLTHERPNVYFELGYARGLGKTVITIARDGINIHFDVKDWAYLPYNDSRFLERDLKKRFEYELSKIEPS